MAAATEALSDAALAIAGAFIDAPTDDVTAHGVNEPRATIVRRCCRPGATRSTTP